MLRDFQKLVNIENLKGLFYKYYEVIMYLIFGGLTVVINILTYYIFYIIIGLGNTSSNIIAWILAVAFAFFTNKHLVFKSNSFSVKNVLYEAVTFFGFRLLTGILDVAIMYVSVDILGLNAMIMKVLVNIIVITLNYIASKLVVFKKN